MKKHGMDFSIFAIVIILVSIGVVMVFSSSFYYALARWQNKYYFFNKSFWFAISGFIIMIIVSIIPYKIYRRFSFLVWVGGIATLVLVLTPVGVNLYGAQRWLVIGGVSVMPSEIAKLSAIIFMAHSLERNRENIGSFKEGVVPYLLMSGIYFGLIIMQPDLSTAIIVVLIIMTMVFIAGAKLYQMLGLGVTGIGVFLVFAMSAEYRRERIFAFLDPFKYASDEGWQVVHSLYALGSGGLKGVGIGQSIQNKLYIPEPQNDFIFSTIGEEFGFIGSVIVLILFIALIYRGTLIIANAPDFFASMLSTGIVSMVAYQVIINIGVTTGSLPVTGMSLPFISFGGSSLLTLMASMGILINISQYTQTSSEKVNKVNNIQKVDFKKYNDRKFNKRRKSKGKI